MGQPIPPALRLPCLLIRHPRHRRPGGGTRTLPYAAGAAMGQSWVAGGAEGRVVGAGV